MTMQGQTPSQTQPNPKPYSPSLRPAPIDQLGKLQVAILYCKQGIWDSDCQKSLESAWQSYQKVLDARQKSPSAQGSPQTPVSAPTVRVMSKRELQEALLGATVKEKGYTREEFINWLNDHFQVKDQRLLNKEQLEEALMLAEDIPPREKT